MDTLANNNSGRQQTDGSPFLDNSKLSDAERVRRMKLANQTRKEREKHASDKATFLRNWKRRDEHFAEMIVSLMDQADTGIDEGQQLSLLPEEEGAAEESTPAPAPVVIDRPAWYPHLAPLELAPVTLEELGAPAEARRLLAWLEAQQKTPKITPEVLTSALPELGEAERREALYWLALGGYVRRWYGSKSGIEVHRIDGPLDLVSATRLIDSLVEALPQAPALVPLVDVQQLLLVPREWLDAVVDQLVARGSLRCTMQDGAVQIGWHERNAKIERLLLLAIERAGGKLGVSDVDDFLRINRTEIRRALMRLHAAGEVSIKNGLAGRTPKDQRKPLTVETLDPELILKHVSSYSEDSVQRIARNALLPESLVGEACAALAQAGKLTKVKKPKYSDDAGPWYHLPPPPKKKAKAPAKGKKSPPSKATKPARAATSKATSAKAAKAPAKASKAPTKAAKPARATSTKATPAAAQAAPAAPAPVATPDSPMRGRVLEALQKATRRRSARVIATLLRESEAIVQMVLEALVKEGLAVGARRGGYQLQGKAPAAPPAKAPAAPAAPPAKPRRGGKAAPAPAKAAPAPRRATRAKAAPVAPPTPPREPWADVLSVVVQQLALAEGRPVRVEALHEKTGLPAEQLEAVLNLLEQCEAIEQAYGVWSPCVDLDRFALLTELPKWLHDKICNLLDDNDGDGEITHQRVAGWLEAPEGLVLTILRTMLALHLVREQEGLWLPAKPPAGPPPTGPKPAATASPPKASAVAPEASSAATSTATTDEASALAPTTSAQARTGRLFSDVEPAPAPEEPAPSPAAGRPLVEASKALPYGFDTLTDTDRRVLTLLVQEPRRWTPEALAHKGGWTEAQTTEALRRLFGRGLTTQERETHGGPTTHFVSAWQASELRQALGLPAPGAHQSPPPAAPETVGPATPASLATNGELLNQVDTSTAPKPPATRPAPSPPGLTNLGVLTELWAHYFWHSHKPQEITQGDHLTDALELLSACKLIRRKNDKILGDWVPGGKAAVLPHILERVTGLLILSDDMSPEQLALQLKVRPGTALALLHEAESRGLVATATQGATWYPTKTAVPATGEEG